jgi:hypothetical protein
MTIEKDLLKLRQEKQNPYEQYFLLKNPFPGKGELNEKVVSNQEETKNAFIDKLGKFSEENENLIIQGINGAGKTSILKYFEFYVDEARKRQYLDGKIFSIYVVASEDDYASLHTDIVSELLGKTLFDVAKAFNNRSSQNTNGENPFENDDNVSQNLLTLASNTNLFSDWSAAHADAFKSWLTGNKLNPGEKKFLGGAKDIPNTSMAIRYLKDYIEIAKDLNICDGVVILIDEFEYLFTTLTKAKQSSYVSDIRHLLDVLSSKSIVVFATTPEDGDLDKYPALKRRMGSSVNLKPIGDSGEAVSYAKDYLRYGKELFFAEKEDVQSNENELTDLTPLTEENITEVFNELSDGGNNEVVPGTFLPRMKEKVKEIAEVTIGQE